MSLDAIENEQFRRDILTFLEADADNAMPHALLNKALHSIGNPISDQRLKQQLTWLKTQGLVTLQEVGAIILVKLTQAGLDIALCRTPHPDIAKPAL